MNLNTLLTPRIKQLPIQHKNRNKALCHAYSKLKECSPGDVVYLAVSSPQKNSRIINQLDKLLRESSESKERHLKPVVKISAKTLIWNGSLSPKALTLELLSAMRSTYYSHMNIHRVPHSTLEIALEKTLIFRHTQYVLITNVHEAFITDSNQTNPLNILSQWKCLAQTTGVILIFD